MVITYTVAKYIDQPGMIASPARGKLNRKKCPRLRLRIWSRERDRMCSAVPSLVSLLIFYSEAESALPIHEIPPTFRDGFYRHGSGQSRVYQVTQLRTEGVSCRESAGTRPVVLNIESVTGAALSGITMDRFLCTYYFPMAYSGHLRCQNDRMS